MDSTFSVYVPSCHNEAFFYNLYIFVHNECCDELMFSQWLKFLSLSLSLSHTFLSTKQDKPAFIFCVEDKALFCLACDEPIHLAGSLSAKHQRFLATGISVALSSSCKKDTEESCLEPPHQKSQQISMKMPTAKF